MILRYRVSLRELVKNLSFYFFTYCWHMFRFLVYEYSYIYTNMCMYISIYKFVWYTCIHIMLVCRFLILWKFCQLSSSKNDRRTPDNVVLKTKSLQKKERLRSNVLRINMRWSNQFNWLHYVCGREKSFNNSNYNIFLNKLGACYVFIICANIGNSERFTLTSHQFKNFKLVEWTLFNIHSMYKCTKKSPCPSADIIFVSQSSILPIWKFTEMWNNLGKFSLKY